MLPKEYDLNYMLRERGQNVNKVDDIAASACFVLL